MMMLLGAYRFSVRTAAYRELRRVTEYRWRAQPRLGRRPARQFVGVGEDRIDLDGVIYPHYRGGRQQIQLMRLQAGLGKPLPLVDGTGFIYGLWAIERIEETASYLDKDGRPRRQEFRLSIARYGEEALRLW
ncbi:phage tail protein [Thioalkalivibrio sulfidiphilus]|uniref:phage tail protein n=1 Tax=Thioalkalivibrio sulfidiphilus TaxID=1033854 RepID=UPI003B2E3E15